jgi:hypothetical protein
MGGRIDSRSQPNKKPVAAPHTRPWQGPMPQRVCSLAARHESYGPSRPRVTSSQRHTIVSGVASCIKAEVGRMLDLPDVVPDMIAGIH